MASQEWTEFVPTAVRASFWMRKFSSIVSRAEARTPTDCGPWSSAARRSPVAAAASASSQVAADGLKGVMERHSPQHVGVLSSARLTNEENYLSQKLARTGLQTHSVHSCEAT